MSKKILSIFTTFLVTVFVIVSSLTVSGAENYKTWLQGDSRWGSKVLGTSGDTMAQIGCAVTSMAIQVAHSGSKSADSFNPGILVDYLSQNGGFDSAGNLYWGTVTGLVSNFTFEKRAYFSAQNKTIITNELANYINQGYYIVMSVNYNGHWIAIDTIKDGVVYMMDPAQNKSTKLFDYYDVAGMMQMRLFKGAKTPAKVEGATAPATTYLTGHYKTTSNLNLRSSYSTSSDKLLTIPSDKTIVVLRVYNNEWGMVEYGGKTGWVFLEYTTYTEGAYTYKLGSYKCNVTTGVNMRSGVGADKTYVCLVPYNATVNISSVTNNWGKATYGTKSGYICMEYLTYTGTQTTTTTTTATTTKATTTTTKTTTTTTTTRATTTTTPTTTKVVTTTTVATTTLPVVKGDIDRDGKVDSEDVLSLNVYINEPKELTIFELYVYDLNGDGVVSDLDVVYLMKEIKK